MGVRLHRNKKPIIKNTLNANVAANVLTTTFSVSGGCLFIIKQIYNFF